ncbi:MAG: hydrogenase maturation nickel metallochaperone HypA [Gammaproteobacteria bacterium]
MHELSICQALMTQVEAVAREHGATRVTTIKLHIGPLAGVEPRLLEQAFTIASAGTVAAEAILTLEQLPLRVSCTECGAVTDALPNRLVCGHCGDWRTRLVSGDELQLTRVELARAVPGEHGRENPAWEPVHDECG